MRGYGLLFAQGGSCGMGSCGWTQMQQGGADCKIGVLQPRFGGKRKTRKNMTKGGTCGCGVPKPAMMELPSGVRPSSELVGGQCGCSAPMFQIKRPMTGGACACQIVSPKPVALGGYKPTKRNLKYLKKWKEGKSIGFTMRSSLKAKGLIPRANGTYRVSPKYQGRY